MAAPEFYYFDLKIATRTLYAEPVLDIEDNEAFRKTGLNLVIGNYKEISMPVQFKHKYGFRLDDILQTGHGILFLISEKLKKIFEENKLTGWKTFDVKILGKKGNEIT